ncbi:hypothetical protein [Streptomyces sp. NPDC002054]|uniref:hypothetical protein n=1 Tax=Streptomyces sp. NPDC002054 TaxID=3154663 RepID=UPI00331BE8E6
MDVVTDPDALSIPPKISAEMVTGFALSASKIVLDGGVGRMPQMAGRRCRDEKPPPGGRSYLMPATTTTRRLRPTSGRRSSAATTAGPWAARAIGFAALPTLPRSSLTP